MDWKETFTIKRGLMVLSLVLLAGASSLVYDWPVSFVAYLPANTQSVTIKDFYSQSCMVEFADNYGSTLTKMYTPCEFNFNHLPQIRVNINSVSRGILYSIFTTDSSDNINQPIGTRVGLLGDYTNLQWNYKAYQWYPLAWTNKVCTSCNSVYCDYYRAGVGWMSCTNNAAPPPTSFSCSTSCTNGYSNGGCSRTCTNLMPSGSRINPATVTKSCGAGDYAAGCSITCSVSSDQKTMTSTISVSPSYGGHSCSPCSGSGTCSFTPTVVSEPGGPTHTECINAGISYPERMVPSTFNPNSLICDSNTKFCFNTANGAGVLVPRYINAVSYPVNGLCPAIANSYPSGTSCGGTQARRAKCYIDGPQVFSPVVAGDSGKTGAIYNPDADNCQGDTCAGSIEWQYNAGTRVEDSSGTFRLEWRGGTAYFSIINPQFYTNEAVKRNTINAPEYRPVDCPLLTGYRLDQEEFRPGELVSLIGFNYTPKIMCAKLPAVILDIQGKQIMSTDQNLSLIMNGGSYTVPPTEVHIIPYIREDIGGCVSSTECNPSLLCDGIVGQCVNHQCVYQGQCIIPPTQETIPEKLLLSFSTWVNWIRNLIGW